MLNKHLQDWAVLRWFGFDFSKRAESEGGASGETPPAAEEVPDKDRKKSSGAGAASSGPAGAVSETVPVFPAPEDHSAASSSSSPAAEAVATDMASCTDVAPSMDGTAEEFYEETGNDGSVPGSEEPVVGVDVATEKSGERVVVAAEVGDVIEAIGDEVEAETLGVKGATVVRRRVIPLKQVLAAAGLAAVLTVVRALRRRRRGKFPAGGTVVLADVSLQPPPLAEPPAAPQGLRGLKFAASDVFDIVGHTTSLGRPEWKAATRPAEKTAPILARIVQNGGELVSVTNVASDFLSIQGRNSHYGTPTNPAAPAHMTGGFHSGAASAVASGLVDFAVAAEGFGGLRVPAACCGLLGFMASPMTLPEEGLWNAAVNTSAFSWTARSAEVLAAVGAAATGKARPGRAGPVVRRILIAEDLFALAGDEQAANMLLATFKRAAFSFVGQDNVAQIKLGDLLSRNVPSLNELGGPTPFENLQAAYTIVAAYECAKQCSKWSEANPAIAASVAEGIEHASQITEDAYNVCVQVMTDVRKVMYLTLGGGTAVALPTIGTPPIKWSSSSDAQEQWAVDAMRMCALAPMAACPQLTMPAGTTPGGVPLSVSLVAQHDSDMALLGAAEGLSSLLVEEATKAPAKPKVDPEEAKRAKAAAEQKRRTERAESYKDAGNRAFKEGKYEEAIRQYARAIETNPKQATYYSNRAMASLKVMDFTGAEEDCNRALKLELNAKTLLRRGTARLGLHNFEGSLKDFKQVVAMEPNNRQARIELKNLKEMKARFEEMQAATEGSNQAVFGGPPIGGADAAGMMPPGPGLGGM